jgi:Ca-activated chloride channel homolog
LINQKHNKGVVLQNNKKLPECIAAYKQALKLNPADEDARQNLQQALKQLQQQQQQNKKQKQEDKKQQQEKEEPKPQPSKITKKDAEEKLKALLQQEKNLQDKLKKANAATPDKPEKDW